MLKTGRVNGEGGAVGDRAGRKLTPKQERFVAEYLVDLNAAAAYHRAGYKVKNGNVAAVEGHNLLRNPKIAQAVGAAIQARADRVEVRQDAVVRELAAVAFSDLGQILDFSGDWLR